MQNMHLHFCHPPGLECKGPAHVGEGGAAGDVHATAGAVVAADADGRRPLSMATTEAGPPIFILPEKWSELGKK